MKIGFWVCLIMILSWWRSFWWIFHPAFEQFRNVFGVGCISGSLVRPRTSVCVRLTIIVVTKINGWLQVLQMKIMSRWLVKGQSLTKSLLGHVDISLKPSLPLALGDWLIMWITWKTILAVTVVMAIKPCLELSELLFQVGVPVIFYIIVSSLRKVGSYGSPSIAQKSLEVDYHLLFMIGEVTAFDTRPQIICPSKPAALTASQQTSVGRNWSPIPWTMFLNVRDQDDVFLWSPWPFLHPNFVTARWPSHNFQISTTSYKL